MSLSKGSGTKLDCRRERHFQIDELNVFFFSHVNHFHDLRAKMNNGLGTRNLEICFGK